MTTPSAHWPAIRALFESTAELSAAERAPLIAAAALQADAHVELLSLLQHHDRANSSASFMAETAVHALAGAAVRTGQRLGAWEIVRAIGSGGMGEVFEVRRADGQYDGRAAVKLLKRGMDSAAVLRRFALERQALARLSHPHIARLLDAGASADGLPYFVLEYVDGRPIDEAVRGLALERRLALFLQLADAVVHAHRNLLVHRDLKPGNVLVDGDGHVKLLDFGIAKALDPLEGRHDEATGNTTLAGQRPFTPHYASPEQVRGEPVSTATDIYSLGVLLYQLLTGTRPTGRLATSPAEVARSVLEEQPTRPSRLTASEAVDPQWLSTRKRLEGDLDNILLKALEKSPERRYGSVDMLAADVRAYLEGRPVAAREPSAWYVFSKFAGRHRWAVLAGLVGGTGLVTGLAATLMQGRLAAALGVAGLAFGLGLAVVQGWRAERARARAESHVGELRKLTNRVVFDYFDAVEKLPGSIKVREQMLADTTQYLDNMEAQAARDPKLAWELARISDRLACLQGNTYGEGLEQVEPADRNFTRALRFVDWATAGPVSDGELLLESAVIVVSASLFDQRLGRLAPAPGVDPATPPVPGQPRRRDTLSGLWHGRQLIERGAALLPSHPQMEMHLGTLRGRMGLVLGHNTAEINLGRWREAEPHLRASLEHMRRFAQSAADDPEGSRQLAWALVNLASWERLAGDPSRALAAVQEAVASIDRATQLAPDNRTYSTMANLMRTHLAAAKAEAGDVESGVADCEEALARLARTAEADPDNPVNRRDTALVNALQGRMLIEHRRMAAAVPPLRRAYALLALLPGASTDAYVTRWRAEACAARARAELDGAGDARLALSLAEEALALLAANQATQSAPHAARIVRAQAEATAGAALRRLGGAAPATRRFDAAMAHWAAFEQDGEPLPRALAARRQATREEQAAPAA